MCLKYGTPHRYRLAVTQGIDFPPECHGRKELLGLLRDEVAAGVYNDDTRYHPLLALGLRGLAEREDVLHPTFREPHYPFCDLVQAVALVAGISNVGNSMPTLAQQHCRIVWGEWSTRPNVYYMFWYILQACWPAERLQPWEQLLKTVFRRSGWNGLMMQCAMQMEQDTGEQVIFPTVEAA